MSEGSFQNGAARKRPRRRQLRRARIWARKSTANALELVRLGRLTPAESMAFDVVDRTALCRLRRYPGRATGAPLLLVPPLMLTAEIYDVAPDTSAVRQLTEAGIDTWVIDFGAPEREEGGMTRTLDDHVRAVAWAIGRVRELTGKDVHLAGYSQGGMFVYQAAAYRRSVGVASLITFGSPVDIHKNLPRLGSDVAGRFIRAVSPMVEMTLERIEGIPGALNSLGFKLLSPRKEVEQMIDFVRKLHDRRELARRESRRRFLGGEGFVAWPGPALRRFFDEFVVHNRMVSGGIVIDGRSVTLADIRVPILTFVGSRDEFARPAAVRAIRDAAPNAEVLEVGLRAGHFGLVVGSLASCVTWPAVVDWVRWRDGDGPLPAALAASQVREDDDEPEEAADVDFDRELLGGEIAHAVAGGLSRVGTAVRDVGETFEQLRWQVPRLRRLERMHGDTRISASLVLAEQAATIGEQTFFLWRGRAFSYAEANARIDAVARGLVACGVKAGDRVAVLMASRPSYLSLVTALNRIGAVAVLPSPELDGEAVARGLDELEVTALACDPERVDMARQLSGGREVLVLGGAGSERARDFGAGVVDMEAIDPDSVELPERDPGLARELALAFVHPGRRGEARISRISNGRWAFSALGVAAAATLRPSDTVYCCLPLHHPTGLLVATGGALVGGARLALSGRLSPDRFWTEVRRYGATVVFYAGEMARPLVEAPARHGERHHPVRLFAGSGMRPDVWRRLRERFGVGVLELYASTERNLVLANASGEKVGCLGRPLPGSKEVALVEHDFVRDAPITREGGTLRRVDAGQPGVAAVRVGEHVTGPRVVCNAFEPGDRWYLTEDVLRRDGEGDYWFVDKLASLIHTPQGPVATPRLEDALYLIPGVRLAAAYAVDGAIFAAAECRAPLDPERATDVLCAELLPHERPRTILRVSAIPLNNGYRPIRARLRALGRDLPHLEALVYDPETARYLDAITLKASE